MDNKPDYANWISSKVLMFPIVTGAVAAALLVAASYFDGGWPLLIVRLVLACLVAISLVLFTYLAYARRLLAYDGGGIQGKILDNVLNHLDWNGNGSLLDIGCGSGAMAVRAARKFPEAKVVGIDYWGFGWDYAKEQCESNAKLEGLSDRISFQHGDAAKLDFPDNHFDQGESTIS